MRFLYLLLVFLISTTTLLAQQSLTYSFQNTFAEDGGRGPALAKLDSGYFRIDTLPCAQRTQTVYHFYKNCGLVFDNVAANNWFKKSYTIEMYFSLDNLSSWKRVIDFKNRTTDKGCYVFNGRLNFFDIATSDSIPFAAGNYQYYVVTRDSTTRQVRVYSSGRSQISFIDNDTNATLNSANLLKFFQDDLQIRNEASSGDIAYLKLYSSRLDSTSIASRFTNLCTTLSVPARSSQKGKMQLAPNPTQGFVNINLQNVLGAWQYTLYAADGRISATGQANHSTTQLDLHALPKGLYILRVTTVGGVLSTNILKE